MRDDHTKTSMEGYAKAIITYTIDFLVFIGATLRKPHIDEFVANSPYISGIRRAINHFRSLFCGFLRCSLIQKPFTNCSRAQRAEDAVYLLDSDNKGRDRRFTDLSIQWLER